MHAVALKATAPPPQVVQALPAEAAYSPAEQAALQEWLQQPTQPLAEQHPLAELLKQRIASYGRVMPPHQASVATMVERGIALAATPPTVS